MFYLFVVDLILPEENIKEFADAEHSLEDSELMLVLVLEWTCGGGGVGLGDGGGSGGGSVGGWW